MSDWIHVAGFMVLADHISDRIIPDEYKEDDCPYMVKSVGFYSLNEESAIYNLLVKPRDMRVQCWSNEDMKGSVLPNYFTLDLYNPDDPEDRRVAYIDVPDEDQIKSYFPNGSEGPLDLTVSPVFNPRPSADRLYHVAFSGGLRHQFDLQMIKDWWEMMKKYLPIQYGSIYCTNNVTEPYTDFVTGSD